MVMLRSVVIDTLPYPPTMTSAEEVAKLTVDAAVIASDWLKPTSIELLIVTPAPVVTVFEGLGKKNGVLTIMGHAVAPPMLVVPANTTPNSLLEIPRVPGASFPPRLIT